MSVARRRCRVLVADEGADDRQAQSGAAATLGSCVVDPGDGGGAAARQPRRPIDCRPCCRLRGGLTMYPSSGKVDEIGAVAADANDVRRPSLKRLRLLSRKVISLIDSRHSAQLVGLV